MSYLERRCGCAWMLPAALLLAALSTVAEGACQPPTTQFANFRTIRCAWNRREVDHMATTFQVGTYAHIRCALGYSGIRGETVDDTAWCGRNGRWVRAGRSECCRRTCGTVSVEQRISDGMIMSGRSTSVLENPWHVAVYKIPALDYMFEEEEYQPEYVCGGTILTRRLVIAAAHCFWDRSSKSMKSANEFVVAAGKDRSAWSDFESQNFGVMAIHADPSYREYDGRYDQDVAVLVLDGAIEFNRYVAPICMDYDVAQMSRVLVPEAMGRVAGWGFTSHGGDLSDKLQKADMPIVDREVCRQSVHPMVAEFLTDDKFCVGYMNGTSVGPGDSGGGLVFGRQTPVEQQFYLGGIVSNGRANAANEYSFFSNIVHFHELIFEAARTHLPNVRCPWRVAIAQLAKSYTATETEYGVMMQPGATWYFDCQTAVCGPDGEFTYTGRPCRVISNYPSLQPMRELTRNVPSGQTAVCGPDGEFTFTGQPCRVISNYPSLQPLGEQPRNVPKRANSFFEKFLKFKKKMFKKW